MRYFISLLALLHSLNTQAQFAYQEKPVRQGLVLGLGTLTTAGAFFYSRTMAPPTETLINNLSPNNLWRIDRPAIRFYQTKAATISDWIATGSLCLPAMLLMDQQIRKKPLTPLSISLQATLATATTTLIAKSLTRRFRPYAYNPKVPMSVKTTQDTRESFFSGHTAMTACMTVSAATIWSDHHPNHTAKPWVWAGALAVPAAVACLRIKAGKHFFTDVLAGYAVGVAFGLLAPRLYRH